MRLEIGKKVGVITGGGIVFGTVDFIYPYGEIRVAGSWNGDFYETPAQYVFPVWEGNYIAEDVLELVIALRKFDYNLLADDIKNLPYMEDIYIPSVLRNLLIVGEYIGGIKGAGDIEDLIDKFIDWAAHGFSNAKEARA